MRPGATTLEGSAAERTLFSPDVQAAVRAELDGMLKAPIFSQSNRCKRFLSYIVLQTLSGNAGELKERTIGISVFERTNDYDTGDDSIVRVTANDIRKRLSQYYRESVDAHPVQIELPRGSYVPEFRFHPPRPGKKSAEGSVQESVYENAKPSEISNAQEALISPEYPEVPGLKPAAPEAARFTGNSRGRLLILLIVVLLILAGTVGFGLLRKWSAGDVPDLWGSFIHATNPVLVCIDTHELPVPGSAPSGGQTFVDMVLRKQIIALDDASVLSSMAAVLGKKDIAFRVVGAEQVSLADLRRQPIILIGAIDNKWTIRLTQRLRYRIEVANPPGSGAGKQPIASIVDSEQPASRWTTDLAIPFNAWKSDYAVISRTDDPTTGVPVLIEAGLGNDGTLAASELVTSGRLSTSLETEPSCRSKKNFEAVIETQIIDTKSGPPHVLRVTCW